MVVDDAADLRELVADLLRMKGHDVRTFEDGPSALALTKGKLFVLNTGSARVSVIVLQNR